MNKIARYLICLIPMGFAGLGAAYFGKKLGFSGLAICLFSIAIQLIIVYISDKYRNEK